jgi:2-keto-4-pentenoate hydratase/2-oxohepta-3-ene-1,7-dioic acid hydratase in catechol pathway
MRIARIHTPGGIIPVADVDSEWAEIDSIVTHNLANGGRRFPLTEVQYAPPCEPRVVFGMLHNGIGNTSAPPQAFMKSARSVCGNGDPVFIDPQIGAVKGEGELTIVISRDCRFITPDEARDYILGWTIGNDVSNMDQAALDSTVNQAKGGDNYAPIGPWIETDLNPLDTRIVVHVDGAKVCDSNTSKLARNAYEVLSYLSQYHTLGPGDIVMIGAPQTAFDLAIGQQCEITIAGIGILTNTAVTHPRSS